MSERFMKNLNGEKVFSLEYDKETLRDMVIEKQEQIERLNNIIDKAIEYINTHYFGTDGFGDVNEIKNILKGDNK